MIQKPHKHVHINTCDRNRTEFTCCSSGAKCCLQKAAKRHNRALNTNKLRFTQEHSLNYETFLALHNPLYFHMQEGQLIIKHWLIDWLIY